MPRVEWNQEVETLPAKAAAESLAHRVRLRGSHRRSQNVYPQIGKALIDFLGEDAVLRLSTWSGPFWCSDLAPPGVYL